MLADCWSRLAFYGSSRWLMAVRADSSIFQLAQWSLQKALQVWRGRQSPQGQIAHKFPLKIPINCRPSRRLWHRFDVKCREIFPKTHSECNRAGAVERLKSFPNFPSLALSPSKNKRNWSSAAPRWHKHHVELKKTSVHTWLVRAENGRVSTKHKTVWVCIWLRFETAFTRLRVSQPIIRYWKTESKVQQVIENKRNLFIRQLWSESGSTSREKNFTMLRGWSEERWHLASSAFCIRLRPHKNFPFAGSKKAKRQAAPNYRFQMHCQHTNTHFSSDSFIIPSGGLQFFGWNIK